MSDHHEAGCRPYARTSRDDPVYYWRQTQNHPAREAPRTHRTTGIPERWVDLRSVPLEATHCVYKINSSDTRYPVTYQLCKAAQASLQLHHREMGQKTYPLPLRCPDWPNSSRNPQSRRLDQRANFCQALPQTNWSELWSQHSQPFPEHFRIGRIFSYYYIQCIIACYHHAVTKHWVAFFGGRSFDSSVVLTMILNYYIRWVYLPLCSLLLRLTRLTSSFKSHVATQWLGLVTR